MLENDTERAIRMRPPGLFAAVVLGDGQKWWDGLTGEEAREVIQLDALYYELADRRLELLSEMKSLERRIRAVKGRVREISDKAR